MKQFISFVNKEFRHIFRDRRTVLILLVMPVIQIILFGFAITTEVRNANIAILDMSKDVVTQRLNDRFESSRYFTVTDQITDYNQIDKLFKQGDVNMVLVFSDNFEDNLFHTGEAPIQLIADGTEPNQASMLVNYASAILGSYQQELNNQYGVPFQIVPEVKMLYNPQQEGAYNFVPGVMGMILILICSMMTSIAIVREKETGTMEVLLASPINPIYIIVAKAVPYFVISVMNLVSILLLSVYVLNVPIAGSILLLVAISVLFIFLALCLGLLISTLVNTQVAAMLASGMGLMMPVMLLSGMVFPVESMPKILQGISALIPARWYIESVKKIMIQGVEIQFVAKEILILAAMALLLMIISLRKFKIRLM